MEQHEHAAPHPAVPDVELSALREAGKSWPSAPEPTDGSSSDLSTRTMQRGAHMGDKFVRVQQPREFRHVRRGEVQATQAVPRAQGPFGRYLIALRAFAIGDPLSNELAIHERLTKVKALAVLSSDALSSVAYATESMLGVLVLAGLTALGYSLGIALAIAALFAIVAVSYRQTIKAYPKGGGSYIVASDNLGPIAGLIAGASIMIDYTLTVAVSISAGVLALVSLDSGLAPYQLLMDIGFVILLVLGNLRGIRESGSIFMIPTYLFVGGMYLVIVLGAARLFGIAGLPAMHVPPQPHYPAIESISVFLILRAFASGCTALTGVEAISDGTPAFQPVEWRNARATLSLLALIAITTFGGVTLLVHKLGLLPDPTGTPTLLSKLAFVVGGTPLLWYVQITTALILALAANTAYSDFPRLCYFMARDRYLPQQFTHRGDRLSYSNGIMALTVLALILIVLFSGSVDKLVNLYVIGVFASFTLSQAGMVWRWWSKREDGWRKGLALNGSGGVVTALVLVITAVTKFALGAWIVVILVPLLVLGFLQIHRHYRHSEKLLRPQAPPGPDSYHHTLIIVPSRESEEASAAWTYANNMHAERIILVTPHAMSPAGSTDERRPPDAPVAARLPIVESVTIAATAESVRALIKERRRQDPHSTFTVIVPASAYHTYWQLEQSVGVSVAALGPQCFLPARRRTVIVLVTNLNQSTLEALAYTRSLMQDRVVAVHVAADMEDDNDAMRERWKAWGEHLPLTLISSPYRAVVGPMLSYVKALEQQAPDDLVTVVLPEVVPASVWERALYGRTARRLRSLLLQRSRTAVVSVPFLLGQQSAVDERQPT